MLWEFGFCRGRIYPSRGCLVCVNGRYLPRIDERAYLGTDKSVPYDKGVVRFICVHYLLKRFHTEAQRHRGREAQQTIERKFKG
ncbi:MAG: hypothetical protein FWG87_09805 [Defluviitaleaceae bacterium]|nr:hypothetical protein [Defluviitaleaceae bacterium]